MYHYFELLFATVCLMPCQYSVTVAFVLCLANVLSLQRSEVRGCPQAIAVNMSA